MKYLGIDVGGTNIAVGIVDENNKLIAKASNKTPVPCSEDVFCDCVAKTSFEAMEKAGVTLEELPWIGLGCPVPSTVPPVLWSSPITWVTPISR